MGKHIGDCLELVIRFEAGSDFQYDHAHSLLEGMGRATSEHLRGTHKNNWCYTKLGKLEHGVVKTEIKQMEEDHARYQELYLAKDGKE